MDTAARIARRALGLLDLTRLGEDDAPEDADALVARAVTPHGPVAGVCLWPRFVARAREALGASPVRIATVANFPAGDPDPAAAASACAAAIADGADEVDVVFPHEAWRSGDERTGVRLVAECRAAVGDEHVLKVILETGAWPDASALRAAAEACVDAGAGFLKTSTGKIAVGATLDAAQILLEAIAARPERTCGIKASGGIRALADAAPYMERAAAVCGEAFVRAATFRFGASGLLDDILRELDA